VFANQALEREVACFASQPKERYCDELAFALFMDVAHDAQQRPGTSATRSGVLRTGPAMRYECVYGSETKEHAFQRKLGWRNEAGRSERW
jgi:hypothetical protein